MAGLGPSTHAQTWKDPLAGLATLPSVNIQRRPRGEAEVARQVGGVPMTPAIQLGESAGGSGICPGVETRADR
jgi:hypothetical protein